jgi:hypothetical protein
VQGATGGDTAALIMGMMQEMRRDMGMLAQAFNAPKKLIRDPQNGRDRRDRTDGGSINGRVQQVQPVRQKTFATRFTISGRIRSRSC